MKNDMICLAGVSKKFKEKIIFEGLNLEVAKGECIGIVGENGVGKSVLFKMITGLMRMDKGEIFIDGELLGEQFDFSEKIGAVINYPGFFDYYSGYDNLKYLSLIQNKIKDKEIFYAMDMVGLDPQLKTKVGKYSLGMRQKLGIAQAIMERQEILILDEPFNAIDYKSQKEIEEFLLQEKAKGRTILLTSHNQEILDRISDKLYIISEYKLELMSKESRRKYFCR